MAANVSRDVFLRNMNALVVETRSTRPAFARTVSGLALHVPPALAGAFERKVLEEFANPSPDTPDALMDVLIKGTDVSLWGIELAFQSRAALRTIIDEILIRQEYHFRSEVSSPTVIDAGANIGLAAYYVRRMCKAGKVICFEPNPATFAILQQNVRKGGWENVELHNAALSGQDGKATLSFSEDTPLSASLTPRNADQMTAQVSVPTLNLRPFLDQPVGLLKIDIEGAEADVLETCAKSLDQVENVFVEVHPVHGQVPGLLVRVLNVLETAGFMVHVARSPWSERSHGLRPLCQAHRTYSLSVYGTRLPAHLE